MDTTNERNPGLERAGQGRSEAEFAIALGLRESERALGGRLFWEAFGPKLGRSLGTAGEALITNTLGLDRAFAARRAGQLVGLLGFHWGSRAFCGLDWAALRARLGWAGALRSALLLLPLERKPAEGELLLDGLCVAPAERGRGVGSALLRAVEAHAETLGCRQLRLDVVAENPRARRLYERSGYLAGPCVSTWPFGSWYGVRASTSMTRRLPANP